MASFILPSPHFPSPHLAFLASFILPSPHFPSPHLAFLASFILPSPHFPSPHLAFLASFILPSPHFPSPHFPSLWSVTIVTNSPEANGFDSALAILLVKRPKASKLITTAIDDFLTIFIIYFLLSVLILN
ncbi:hypothetical protein CPS_3750 [Colwellia psychrerythraea 34H]|uniref:Uncharacterized protein n=1 Tax=Colwellia psychrerythraea (strain 34H / ATCC BAA-681) TaxID=167879 RepID=Q47XQ3_COLP3|nr:hypothetical protein CPS_3750 [Colwellia psychrerythraea 34H]